METELLTCEEVGARLRVRPGTVRLWTRAGRIPAVRIGPKTIRYDWRAVRAALDGTGEPNPEREARP